MKWLLVALLGAVGAVALFGLVRYFLRKVLSERAGEIEISFDERKILRHTRRSNFFGQRSRKWAQLRGNGLLVLTPEELIFYMYYPRKEWHVPLGSIDSIEHPRHFMGRSALKELLVVNYASEEDENEGIGILVLDPHEWAAEIMAARGELLRE